MSEPEPAKGTADDEAARKARSEQDTPDPDDTGSLAPTEAELAEIARKAEERKRGKTADMPARPEAAAPDGADESGSLSEQIHGFAAGDITRGIIRGPAEMCGEFDDAGNAYAAKANLEIYLRWCASGVTDKAPPAVALIVNQSGLDPVEDRPRKTDWPAQYPPPIFIEGGCVVLPAPKTKEARDIVRKVFNNSKPKRIFDRPAKHPATGPAAVAPAPSHASHAPAPGAPAAGGGSGKLVSIAIVIIVAALAVAAAYFGGVFGHAKP
jgi:hypothetical protein